MTPREGAKERLVPRTLDSIFREGGAPDTVWMTLEAAHSRGLMGCWEYQWRRLLRFLWRW